jgi:hypothetical protein
MARSPISNTSLIQRKDGPSTSQGGSQEVLLEDEDLGRSTTIATNSEEFVRNYVDNNIKSVEYWNTAYAVQEKRYRDFWVNYSDGRRLKFNLDDIQVRRQINPSPGSRTVRIAIPPRRYIKRNGFIYPEFYGEGSTPRLIDAATTIAFNHKQRETFLTVAETTFKFAMILSAYATPPEIPETLAERPAGLRRPITSVGGGSASRLAEIREISWQDLAEWEQLELAGTGGRVSRAMREGGHLLEKHVYITDEALQIRAPQIAEKVATKFNDADTAVFAINRALKENIGQLKSYLAGLKTGEVGDGVELITSLDKSVGYGYRALEDGSLVRLDNLRKVAVWVLSDGVGGWLIRTAHPIP